VNLKKPKEMSEPAGPVHHHYFFVRKVLVFAVEKKKKKSIDAFKINLKVSQ
jgi:hypothetical protein